MKKYIFFAAGFIMSGFMVLPIVHELCHAIVGFIFYGGVYALGWDYSISYGGGLLNNDFLLKVSGYIGEATVYTMAFLLFRRHGKEIRYFFSAAAIGTWWFVSFNAERGPMTDLLSPATTWTVWIAVSALMIFNIAVMVKDFRKANLQRRRKTGIVKTGYGRIDV